MEEPLPGVEEFLQGGKLPALEAELPLLEGEVPAHGAKVPAHGAEDFPLSGNDPLQELEDSLREEKGSRLGADE